MLSSVLNSKKAVSVNIEIMVTFIKMRHYVFSKSDTNEQIAELRKLLMLYIENNDKRVNDIIVVLFPLWCLIGTPQDIVVLYVNNISHSFRVGLLIFFLPLGAYMIKFYI
jgi:hypothetical protein